jgi:hypothetical protein
MRVLDNVPVIKSLRRRRSASPSKKRRVSWSPKIVSCGTFGSDATSTSTSHSVETPSTPRQLISQNTSQFAGPQTANLDPVLDDHTGADDITRVSNMGLAFPTHSERFKSQPVPRTLVGTEQAWSGMNVLTLDGGGISRGFYTLFILAEIMSAIRQEEHAESNTKLSADSPDTKECRWTENSKEFLPCHYFDYICGTSSGG